MFDSDPTHMMRMVDPIVIGVETLRIDCGYESLNRTIPTP